MHLPAGSALLLALGALAGSACGESESRPSVAGTPVADAAPAASTSADRPGESLQESKAGTVDGPQRPTADPDTEYDRGAALAAARRFADARRVFEEAARLAPTDGSLAAAVAMFADVDAKRISEDVVQRLFQAGQHANAGRWAEAHAEIDGAIEFAPRYARAHGLRGTLWLEQGKPADALNAFEQVVRLDPGFAEGYYNRGATHQALDQHEQAIADHSRAIELQPNFWDAYASRGVAYQNRGLERGSKPDLTAAMADYTQAHELNPGAVEPLYLRGVLYALAEQWDDAEADFTAVIERDAAHAGAYYNRGLAHQQQAGDDSAVADYTKAIELDPADPKPLINRGLLYAKQQNYERAIVDADKAASLAPTLLNPHFNKGQALERIGRQKEAAAEYRTLLEKAGADDSDLPRRARQRLAAIEKAPQY